MRFLEGVKCETIRSNCVLHYSDIKIKLITFYLEAGVFGIKLFIFCWNFSECIGVVFIKGKVGK